MVDVKELPRIETRAFMGGKALAVHRDLGLRDLWDISLETSRLMGSLFLVLAAVALFPQLSTFLLQAP